MDNELLVNEILRNQLLSVRNILTTLSGNIDNTILTFNEHARNRSTSRNRTTTARRNLNNLFAELRNMYPPPTNLPTNLNNLPNNLNNLPNLNNLNNLPTNLNNSTNSTNSTDSTNLNNLNNLLNNSTNLPNNLSNLNSQRSNTISSLNNIINNRLNSPNSTTPDLIEVTLYNNGDSVINNNMEDVQVYPSLRVLGESSSVHIFESIETEYESCSICRENFEPTSIIRKLYCDHIFHINCIDTWFESNIRCAICRSDLRDNEVSQV